jgi:hypothetical protein
MEKKRKSNSVTKERSKMELFIQSENILEDRIYNFLSC